MYSSLINLVLIDIVQLMYYLSDGVKIKYKYKYKTKSYNRMFVSSRNNLFTWRLTQGGKM